ncbi:SCAN domain-containing protein 3-like [Homarus americanus]|uniref:SCAN domain-containing protein 3-like n=1 Tax=Homarus americanus TaxID=6706 RepID=UPI001C47CE49|nr:SCAN domain-containing protein 3-like [Homarus americanus]
MIHRFALASKTIRDELCKILEVVVKCVNFVKTVDLNSRFFQNFCRDMDSEHDALLFYSKVCWLSKGNVVNRVFELRGELKLFLEVQGKDDQLSHFNEVLWEPRLAYLADIFEQLNRLNLKLQGKERNVFYLMDCLRAFLAKLQNWQRKVNTGNVAMFENLSTVLDETEDHLLDPSLKTEITQHLKSLEDEFLDLKNDSAAKDLYEERSLTVFWCSMYQLARLHFASFCLFQLPIYANLVSPPFYI